MSTISVSRCPRNCFLTPVDTKFFRAGTDSTEDHCSDLIAIQGQSSDCLESRFFLYPVVCLFISEEDCTDGANDQYHGFEVLMIQALPYQGLQLDKGMNYSFCLIKALK